MAADTLILALLGLPLLASALVLVLRDMPNLRDGQALLIGLITAACAIELYGRADGDTLFILSLAEGLDISFTPEPLGKLFALVAGVLGADGKGRGTAFTTEAAVRSAGSDSSTQSEEPELPGRKTLPRPASVGRMPTANALEC